MRHLILCCVVLFILVACEEEKSKEGIKVTSAAPTWVTQRDLKNGDFHGVGMEPLKSEVYAESLSRAQDYAKLSLDKQLKSEIKKISQLWAIEMAAIEGISFDQKYFSKAGARQLQNAVDSCQVVHSASWKDVEKKQCWVRVSLQGAQLSKKIRNNLEGFVDKIIPKALSKSSVAMKEEAKEKIINELIKKSYLTITQVLKELAKHRLEN